MNNHLIIILQPFEVLHLSYCECHERFAVMFEQVIPHLLHIDPPGEEGLVHPRGKQPPKIINTSNLGQYCPLCHLSEPKLGTVGLIQHRRAHRPWGMFFQTMKHICSGFRQQNGTT